MAEECGSNTEMLCKFAGADGGPTLAIEVLVEVCRRGCAVEPQMFEPGNGGQYGAEELVPRSAEADEFASDTILLRSEFKGDVGSGGEVVFSAGENVETQSVAEEVNVL